MALLDKCVSYPFFCFGNSEAAFYFFSALFCLCCFLFSLNLLLTFFFLHLIDVLDMVDVLVEGNDDLDEEIGFTLNEDMIIQTFPFSAVVPAALEARNMLLLQTENGTGTDFFFPYVLSMMVDWNWDHFYPMISSGHFTFIASRRRCR